MHEQQSPLSHSEFDLHHDFERIWVFTPNDPQETTYSLVQVPRDTKIHIHYTKTSEQLDFVLIPSVEDIYTWRIQGAINPDIIQSLELPVAVRRKREQPPVVTPADVSMIRNHGAIETIENNPDLYAVDLFINQHRMYDFVNKIWRPIPQHPHFYLGGEKWDQRILPQKIQQKVSMLVERI